MRSKSYITDREVQTALNDVQYYREFHQNNPGFFDATINTGIYNSSTLYK